MMYVIELVSGKTLSVNESDALAVDRAWAARRDIEVQGVKIPATQITGIWPEDIWRAAENERRERRGQEPLATPRVKNDPLPASPFGQLMAGVVPDTQKLSETGKLWLEAMRLNFKAMKDSGKYGTWEVVDGKLSETAQYSPNPQTPVKAKKVTRQLSTQQFNRLREAPGYRIVDADLNEMEFTVADNG